MKYVLTESKLGMRKQLFVLLTVWIIYAVLALNSPDGAGNRYGVSNAQINLIRVSVIVPYFFIWFASLYAAVRFQYYGKLLETSPESEGFNKISRGLWML